MNWQSFPATKTTQRFFAAYLADHVSLKTIRLYLAEIRFAHNENSLPDPFQEAPLLRLLLRGIKRLVGLSSRQRLLITMTLLRQIKEELARAPELPPSDKLMLWLAFTLAFYGFLRSSEFTSPSATQFNPQVHLCFSDVSFTSEGCLTLHLKSSKTDPYCQGCSLLIAPSRRSVCAVRALRKYLSLRSVSGASPLYVFQSGAYLTRAKVTSTLRTLLERLNIPTELYASHSFRIGATTTAAEAGLPPWLIQTLGRWSRTASASISKLNLLSFRRFLRCWPHRTHQDRGDGPRYQDLIVPVIFHKRSVMLAVFGIYFWVHTCHFHLHVAGWVGPLPHLSFHSLPGGTCASIVGSSVVTLQGVSLPPLLHYSLVECVAATLLACTLRGVLLPPPILC